MNYGNSSFYSESGDTSSYQSSGSGSYHLEEPNYVRTTDTYSLSKPLDGQSAVNNEEESYNLIDQPTYGFYQPAYDSYTSPVSDSYASPESVKYYS